MSSGEADIFSVKITGYNDSVTSNNPSWIDWTNTYTYAYSNYIYLYQLICPRCLTTNWGQIDQIITCKGKIGKRACSASLKAIKEKADYEVPVGG